MTSRVGSSITYASFSRERTDMPLTSRSQLPMSDELADASVRTEVLAACTCLAEERRGAVRDGVQVCPPAPFLPREDRASPHWPGEIRSSGVARESGIPIGIPTQFSPEGSAEEAGQGLGKVT